MLEAVDIVIVGGGAAGLAAAIFAAENASGPKRITVLEGTRQCGTKILASGGGRCNVTHEKVTADDFNGSRNIVRNILAAFDAAATVRWFASIGVDLKREETGKLFPVTDSAHTVVNALVNRCRELGVTIETQCKVTDITCGPDGSFKLAALAASAAGVNVTITARRVILATGGRSLPKSGSDGLGWDIVRRLGHTVTDTHQALVPLMLDSRFFHADLSRYQLGDRAFDIRPRQANRPSPRPTALHSFWHLRSCCDGCQPALGHGGRRRSGT